MADLPILDAMSESLLCVREGIRQGMAPRQERSRGNRSICNACIGREVEGSRRRMGRRSLGIREALEDKSIIALTGAGIEDSSASLSSLEGEDGRVGEDRDGGLSKEPSPDEARDEC